MKLHSDVERPLALAAIGLESEFTLFVDGHATRPEDLCRDPRDFLRRPLMHRVGTSYHLPNGGAVYFDTGASRSSRLRSNWNVVRRRARPVRCGKTSTTFARSWMRGRHAPDARCG